MTKFLKRLSNGSFFEGEKQFFLLAKNSAVILFFILFFSELNLNPVFSQNTALSVRADLAEKKSSGTVSGIPSERLPEPIAANDRSAGEVKKSFDFRPPVNKPIQTLRLSESKTEVKDHRGEPGNLYYRYWMVPLDKIAFWPWDDQKYYPVSASRFEEWISLINKKSDKLSRKTEAGIITDLFMEARLEGASFIEGKGKIRFRSPSNDEEGIYVSPFRFYCANFLNGLDRKGDLSLSSTGDFRLDSIYLNKKTNLLSDQETKAGKESDQEYSFSWTRSGIIDPQGTLTFDLDLFSAPSARLRLEVPQEYNLRSSAGLIKESESGNPKMRYWEIFLRGSSPFRLTLIPAKAAKTADLRTVYRQENFYRISLSGIELTSRIYFDRSENTPDRISLLLEKPLEFTSASWKNHSEFRALAGIEKSENGLTASFNIPPGDSGNQELDLQSFASFSDLKLDSEFVLPRPLLSSTEFLWKETSCQVLVVRPLTATSVAPINAVETFDLLSPVLDDSVISYFKYFDSRGGVRVQLTERRPIIRFDSLTAVEMMPVEILTQTKLLVYTDISCGEFSIPITSGWQVDSVQSDDGNPLVWRLTEPEKDSKVSKLTVTLKKIFSSKEPFRVNFSARHSNIGHLEFDLNDLLPLETGELLFGKHFMTLKVEAPWQFSLTDQNGFPLRGDVLDNGDQVRSLFPYSSAGPVLSIENGSSFGKIKIEKIAAGYSGQLNGSFLVDGNVLQESWQISCTPVFGSRVDRILVAIDEKYSSPVSVNFNISENPPSVNLTKKENTGSGKDSSNRSSQDLNASNTVVGSKQKSNGTAEKAPSSSQNQNTEKEDASRTADRQADDSGNSANTATLSANAFNKSAVERPVQDKSSFRSDWKWSLDLESEQAFEVNRLSDEERTSLKLPDGPSIWEIKLKTSRSVPFTVFATRFRPMSKVNSLPLMYLPETKEEQAELKISSLRSDRFKVESNGLKEIPTALFKDTEYETAEGAFRYDPKDLDESLRSDPSVKNIFLRIRREPDRVNSNSSGNEGSLSQGDNKEPRTGLSSASDGKNSNFGTAHAWCWFVNIDSLYDSKGTVRYSANYYIENRGRDHCRFELPAKIDFSSVIAVWLDNQRVTWFPETDSNKRNSIRVLLPVRKRFISISLEYCCQEKALGKYQRVYPVIPECELPILSGTWRLRLPQEWCCENDSINMPQVLSPFPSFSLKENQAKGIMRANYFLDRFGNEDLLVQLTRDKKRFGQEGGSSEIVSAVSDEGHSNRVKITWGDLFSNPDYLNAFFRISMQAGISRIYIDRHAMSKLQILPTTPIHWPGNVPPRSRAIGALENAGIVLVFIEPDFILVTEPSSSLAVRYPLVSLADGQILGPKYKKDGRELQSILYLEQDPSIISSVYWRPENIGSQSPWTSNRKTESVLSNLPGWNSSEVILSRADQGQMTVNRYLLIGERWIYFSLVLILTSRCPKRKSPIPYILVVLIGLGSALLPVIPNPYVWLLLGIVQGAFCSLLLYLLRLACRIKKDPKEFDPADNSSVQTAGQESSSSIVQEESGLNSIPVQQGSSDMIKNIRASMENRDKHNHQSNSDNTDPEQNKIPAAEKVRVQERLIKPGSSSFAVSVGTPGSSVGSNRFTPDSSDRELISNQTCQPGVLRSSESSEITRDQKNLDTRIKKDLSKNALVKPVPVIVPKDISSTWNDDFAQITEPGSAANDDSSSTFIPSETSLKKDPPISSDSAETKDQIIKKRNNSGPSDSPNRSGRCGLTLLSAIFLTASFLFWGILFLSGAEQNSDASGKIRQNKMETVDTGERSVADPRSSGSQSAVSGQSTDTQLKGDGSSVIGRQTKKNMFFPGTGPDRKTETAPVSRFSDDFNRSFEGPAPQSKEPYRVFVPTDTSGNRIPNHYYWIPEEFYQKLDREVHSFQGTSSPWRIKSALYEASINYNPTGGTLSFFHLRAVYKIHLDGSQATIGLPMMPVISEGGAKFDKQAIIPVFEQNGNTEVGQTEFSDNKNDRLTFEITNTTPGEHLLELVLAVPQFDDKNRVNMTIPKVPDSKLILTAPSDAPEISVDGALGITGRKGGILTAELGPIDTLSFVKNDGLGNSNDKNMEVEQFFLLSARSNQTDLQAVFKYRNNGGRIKNLLIQSDRSLIFSGQCRCDESEIESVERDSGQKDLIRVVLKNSVPDTATLRTDYVVKQFSGIGQIGFPQISAAGARIVRSWMAAAQIGRSEYVGLPQSDITSASFLSLSGFEGAENIIAVYDLLKKDSSWLMPIRLKTGKTSVEEYLTLTFYSRETVIDYQAALSSEYQLFRSSFKVDPGFVPEKVHVSDSGGSLVEMPEFLIRNDRLYVFYRTPLVGDYQIRVTGKVRSVLDQEMKIPGIVMDSAEHKDFYLTVRRGSDVCVDLQKGKNWAAAALPKQSSMDPSLENSLLLLDQSVYTGEKSKMENVLAGSVKIQFNRPKLDGTRKSILYRRASGEWMLGIFYSLEITEGEIDTFDFELEDICSGNVTVEPVMKNELIETGRKRILRILPPKIIRGHFDFQFIVPLTVGNEVLRLPKVSLVGVLKDRGINSTLLHPTQLEEVPADTLHYFDFLGETDHRIFLPVRDQMDKTPLHWSISGLVKTAMISEKKDRKETVYQNTYRTKPEDPNGNEQEKRSSSDPVRGEEQRGRTETETVKDDVIPASITAASGLLRSDFNEYRIVRNYSVILNTDRYLSRVLNTEYWFYIRTNGTVYATGNLDVRPGRKDHTSLLLPKEYQLLDLTVDGTAKPFEQEEPGKWRVDLNPDRLSQQVSFSFIGALPFKNFSLKEFFSLSFENNFILARLPLARLEDIPSDKTIWGCAFEDDLRLVRRSYPCLVHQTEKGSKTVWPPQGSLPAIRLDKISNQAEEDWKETCSYEDALPILLRFDLEKMSVLLSALETGRHTFSGNDKDFGRWYSHWLFRWWQCRNEIELSSLPDQLPLALKNDQARAVFIKGSDNLKQSLGLISQPHPSDAKSNESPQERDRQTEPEPQSPALISDLLSRHQQLIDSLGIRSYYEANIANKETAASVFRLLHLHNPKGARFLFGITDSKEAEQIDLVIPAPRKLLALNTFKRLLIWSGVILAIILFMKSASLRRFCLVWGSWTGIFAGLILLSLTNISSPVCWLVIGLSVLIKVLILYFKIKKKKQQISNNESGS